jgi:hypothetical protein
VKKGFLDHGIKNLDVSTMQKLLSGMKSEDVHYSLCADDPCSSSAAAAVESRNVEMCKLIFRHLVQQRPYKVDPYWLLERAIVAGDEAICEYILRNGVDPRKSSERVNVIAPKMAVHMGNPRIVELVLRHCSGMTSNDFRALCRCATDTVDGQEAMQAVIKEVERSPAIVPRQEGPLLFSSDEDMSSVASDTLVGSGDESEDAADAVNAVVRSGVRSREVAPLNRSGSIFDSAASVASWLLGKSG